MRTWERVADSPQGSVVPRESIAVMVYSRGAMLADLQRFVLGLLVRTHYFAFARYDQVMVDLCAFVVHIRTRTNTTP